MNERTKKYWLPWLVGKNIKYCSIIGAKKHCFKLNLLFLLLLVERIDGDIPLVVGYKSYPLQSVSTTQSFHAYPTTVFMDLNFHLLSGMPAETAAAVCCLIFGGVLERFPKLKFCFAHGGCQFCPFVRRK